MPSQRSAGLASAERSPEAVEASAAISPGSALAHASPLTGPETAVDEGSALAQTQRALQQAEQTIRALRAKRSSGEAEASQ
eukprot:11376694-Alexandrium_andersonii.AAC.1